MILALLLLVLVAVDARAGLKHFERDKAQFARRQREAEECTTVWCRKRADRKAARAFDSFELSGEAVAELRRKSIAACTHRDCQKLAVKSAKRFCKRFVKLQRKYAGWLGNRCEDSGCRTKFAGRLSGVSVSACVGPVRKLTETTTAKKTSAPTKKPKTEKKKKTESDDDATERPFSKCERKQRAAWAKEYKLRAQEHTSMEALHKKGSACVSHKCIRRVEQERARLAKTIAESRAERHTLLRKLACTKKSVKKSEKTKKDKKTKKPAEKKEKKKVEKKEKKEKDEETPVKDIKLPRLDPNTCEGRSASLNMELDDLYERMNECPNAECRAPLHEQSAEIRAELDELGECERTGNEDPLSDVVGVSETDDVSDPMNHLPVLSLGDEDEKESNAPESDDQEDDEEETEEAEKKEKADKKAAEKKLAALDREVAQHYAEIANVCNDAECRDKAALKINKLHAQMKTIKAEQKKQEAASAKAKTATKKNAPATSATAAKSSSTKKKAATPYVHVKGGFAKAARLEYNKRSKHYFALLRNVLARCLTKACRRRVLRRFRVDLENRQMAMFRQLTKMAEAKAANDRRECKGRDWTQAKKDACVERVNKWENARIADLKSRQLKLDKRRELRLCSVTSNPEACRAAVEKEFQNDVTALNAPASSKRSASGALLSVSAVLMSIVVLAVTLL